MDTFKDVCNELGVPIAENKTIGLTTIFPFLGFIIATNLMMILIPREKLEKLKLLLKPCLEKEITLKEMESVTGLLSFCSKTIPSSRAFIRRFYDLMGYARKPFHKIRLNTEAKSDIALWLHFLKILTVSVSFQTKFGHLMKLCNFSQIALENQIWAVGHFSKDHGYNLGGLKHVIFGVSSSGACHIFMGRKSKNQKDPF
ncbi:unnamed protein product [Mytilus coruscus]|uniref:Reverse transcriptase domain-containing protein n=1 Tax=Mytilus coruscus TaxID=42192 RepID=A0A6J8CYD8_MYTCO|nr:unnamed protein product [Mytilus coruscus]